MRLRLALGRPFGPRWRFADNQPCQVYNRFMETGDTFKITWSGRCVEGKASGEGELVWEWNELRGVYNGWMRNGSLNGQGFMTWAHGESYEGDWQDDVFHGHGISVLADGERYEGQWRNGKRHGRGTAKYPHAGSYVGEWRDDKPHGTGSYFDRNGVTYYGKWRNGCLGSRNSRRAWVGTSAKACGFE